MKKLTLYAYNICPLDIPDLPSDYTHNCFIHTYKKLKPGQIIEFYYTCIKRSQKKKSANNKRGDLLDPRRERECKNHNFRIKSRRKRSS